MTQGDSDTRWPALSYETRDWQGSWRTYQSAVVPRIQGLDIVDFLDVSTAAEVGAAQHAVTSFDQEMTEAFGQLELGTIETVLMRSEASSSSQIEHLTASAKQLALAELGASRSVNAKLVQANVQAMQGALHRDLPLGTDSIIDMQRDLLGETGLHIGLRAEQVWIGTSESSPIGADFVPPHHERIADDLTDLWAFLRQPTPCRSPTSPSATPSSRPSIRSSTATAGWDAPSYSGTFGHPTSPHT